MGKIKTVVIGDIEAEEVARKKAETKREQKKLAKGLTTSNEGLGKDKKIESVEISKQSGESKSPKSDFEKAQDILKMMADEEKVEKVKPVKEVKVIKKVKEEKTEEPKIEKAKSEKKEEKSAQPKTKHGKKYLEAKALIENNKLYPLAQAIELVKKSSFSSFDGSFEGHFNLLAKGLRGTVQLPHGTGKTVRVAIADDKLLEEVSAGKINFDILVAHPNMMPKLAKVAKILGPKGLMPNPKTNTIGENPEQLVKIHSSGQVSWKTEPDFPLVHLVLGKVSFDSKKIEENYLAIAKSMGKDKIKSVFLKATMGPSVKVSL